MRMVKWREYPVQMCYCLRGAFACALLGALSGVIATSQTIHSRGGFPLPPPPDVEAVPVTDDYFGTKIQDDYRWLENADSPETKTFINDENTYMQRYMEQARIRPQIADDMDALEHVSSWKVPIQRGNDLFFEKMLAGEEQSSIYVRHGWAEKDKRLVDPVQFSRDPNTSVNLDDVSRDGMLVAYDVRQGGADESTVRVFNVKTGKTFDDELPSGIYLSVAFTPDSSTTNCRAGSI
jgi:prolyl oligopeptidase